MSGILADGILPIVESTWLLVDSLGLFDAVINIAYFLLVFLFTMRAWQAAVSARANQIQSLLVYAVVAGVLITGASQVRTALFEGWLATYSASTTWSQRAAASSAERVGAAAAELPLLEGASEFFAGVSAVLVGEIVSEDTTLGVTDGAAAGAGAAATASPVAAVGRVGVAGLRTAMRWFTRALRFLLVPVFAFFLVIIYTSFLITLIASVLFPLAAAFLLTPYGPSLLQKIVVNTASAFATLMTVPFVFGIIINLTLLLPLQYFVNSISEIMGSFAPAEGDARPWWERLGALFTGGGDMMADAVTTFLGAINGLLEAFVFSAVFLFAGLAAALVIVRALDGYISRFVGGITAASLPRQSKGGPAPAAPTASGDMSAPKGPPTVSGEWSHPSGGSGQGGAGKGSVPAIAGGTKTALTGPTAAHSRALLASPRPVPALPSSTTDPRG